MFDYLCQYVFTLVLVQHTPHEKFNRRELWWRLDRL